MKRSDVTGNSFEWLIGEDNVIFSPPPPILHSIRLLGENSACQGYLV